MNRPEVAHVSHAVDVLRHDGQAFVLHEAQPGLRGQVARPKEVGEHVLQEHGLAVHAPLHRLNRRRVGVI